jgi:hypothetical protein
MQEMEVTASALPAAIYLRLSIIGLEHDRNQLQLDNVALGKETKESLAHFLSSTS